MDNLLRPNVYGVRIKEDLLYLMPFGGKATTTLA